jgi:hypothetical protein
MSSCASMDQRCFPQRARGSRWHARGAAWRRCSTRPRGTRTSPGRPTLDGKAASSARTEYERDGVPLHLLRPCERDARDGTDLPNCVKIYLPLPAGPFGAVFRLKAFPEGIRLVYLAFGARHHPRGSHAPTVYELAHQRLHGEPSGSP